MLTPMIPGINIKGTDQIYLLISLIISVVFHEFGHAIACLCSRCQLNNVGFFFFFVLPGANVNMDAEDLGRSSVWDKLKIFSAGVWHNAVLCLIAYLLLIGSPFLLSPLYQFSNDQLYITNIPTTSPLEKSVSLRDQIISVNGCEVTNRSSYINCIDKVSSQNEAYCLSKTAITCLSNNSTLRSCLTIDDINKLSKCDPNSEIDQCNNNGKCIDFSKMDYHLFTIQLKSHNFRKESITFIGSAYELWYSFSVNHYKSRFLFLTKYDIPLHLDNIYNFMMSVSGSLGALNIISIYGLDGEYILDTNIVDPK
eukprot:gene9087-11137_t